MCEKIQYPVPRIDEALAKFIVEHRDDDVRELALKSSKYKAIDVAEAVIQIKGWQIAVKKIPLWAQSEGIIYPKHLSMEQCSSQLTAEYKCRIIGVERESMADLTGGFGVDCTIIGRTFNHVTFVERNEELCGVVQNNFPILNVGKADIICADCTEVLENIEHQNLIFIDPARRDSQGGKTVAIGDCTPDVRALNGLLLEKADMVMIKLSPMLDLTTVERDLEGVAEIHVVSVDGECKEVLAILCKENKYAADEVKFHCINLSLSNFSDFEFTKGEERDAVCHYASSIGKYIYEPNASLMKGCAFKSVAQRYGLEKLHQSSHLYTSDSYVPDFPGRTFHVEGYSSFSKKELKQFLSGVNKANITVRNFPMSVSELRKKLKLADGGDIYLFATTMADGNHVLISCKR